MNGPISIVTSVVADIADRLDATAAEVADLRPPAHEDFVGAEDVQESIAELVQSLDALAIDLSAELDGLRAEARQILDDFLDLDRRIAAAIDAPSLGGAGIGVEGVGGTY